MSVRIDIEGAVDLMLEQIRANIGQALADVRLQRGNTGISLEPPRQYFNYEGARCDRPPSIFVVPKPDSEVDYRKEQGANFVAAIARINVAIVIEDKKESDLQIRAYRYLAALLSILDQKRLTLKDNNYSIVIVVRRSRFSASYTSESVRPGNAADIWRKAVELDCDVNFYERLQINGGS